MGRLIETFREILDQDFYHQQLAASADQATEHTSMTPQDQEILAAVFTDIYQQINAIKQALATPSAGSPSTAQIQQMITDAIEALPAFDTSKIVGYAPATTTDEQTPGTTETAALSDSTSATVTTGDTATSTVTSTLPPPPSPYTTQ